MASENKSGILDSSIRLLKLSVYIFIRDKSLRLKIIKELNEQWVKMLFCDVPITVVLVVLGLAEQLKHAKE